MDNKRIRNVARLLGAIIFCWLYIPHIIFAHKKVLLKSDLKVIEHQIGFNLPFYIQLLYHLHNNKYYRTLFYHRIGPLKSAFIRWYRPGDRYFSISATTKIGEAMWIAHPYSTIINAESIGKHFHCIHLTTIGNKDNNNILRPTIGDNVTLGANVTIIGKVHIGNNVTIGAGSVVVKDIPDNCIVAGNPAKIIRYI